MTENCLLCVDQVSTNVKICFDWMMFHLLENCISLKIEHSMCWKTAYCGSASFPPDATCIDLKNFHLLENCISLYKTNLPYVGKLFTVRRLGLHQCENLLWLRDVPFAGKLYLIITKRFHMLENKYFGSASCPPNGTFASIWKVSICLKIVSHYIKPIYNIMENCLLCVGQVSTNSKMWFGWMILYLPENCISL